MLLAKIWDKITAGIRKNIPANTGFLSLREQEMCRYLFGDAPGLAYFGGYEDSERNMLIFLPDYLDSSYLFGEDSPIVCIEASFFEKDTLSHRDFLGALMGAGISRETVGDISTQTGLCNFFVTAEIAPYILRNFTSAGRTALHLSQIPLDAVTIAEPETKEIRDTVSSLRLDSIVSSGFALVEALPATTSTQAASPSTDYPARNRISPLPKGQKYLFAALERSSCEVSTVKQKKVGSA